MENQVAVIEITNELAPTIYVGGGLNKYFDQVKEAVSGEVPDLTTKKGRDRIASLAAQVSRSKTAVEKPGREYLKHIKELPKEVEKELRDWVTKCDALRDEVRAPLTKWEDEQAAIEAAIITRIDEIKGFAEIASQPHPGFQASLLHDALFECQAIAIDESFGIHIAKAIAAKDAAVSALTSAISARNAYDSEQAELERLRQEQAKREQEERDRLIAEQAALAERQRQEQARIDAERLQHEAERRAEQAKRDAELAERRRIEQEQQAKIAAEQAAIRAQQQAEQAAQRAAEAERQRLEDEAAERERQIKIREADKNHRASINRSALEAMIAEGVPEEFAKAALKAIANGKIPAVKIHY